MVKNIVIAILAILTLTSFTFAYYQKDQAERALAVAEANERRAIEMERKALINAQMAQEQQRRAEAIFMEADRQRQLLETELKKNKKK